MVKSFFYKRHVPYIQSAISSVFLCYFLFWILQVYWLMNESAVKANTIRYNEKYKLKWNKKNKIVI